MIRRLNRFHGQAALRRLQTHSKSVRGSAMNLKYGTNPKRTQYRMAVVVSRKVNKSAVVRNRIRRRLYESVRILSKQFTSQQDMVLIVYDDKLATMPHADIETELIRLFQKAQLLSIELTRHAIVESKE